MKSHEIRMVSECFGEYGEDLKPVVQAGSSDSAALDSVFELLVRAGRDAPEVKTLLVPEAWTNQSNVPEPQRAMYAYCNAVMEPWDGPAAIAGTDGRWVVGGMDRNGLRPLRYTLTDGGLLFVGSETGMVPTDEQAVVEKGRIGPGQMIAVDLAEGKFYHDGEIKTRLAAAYPYDEWAKNIRQLDKKIAGEAVIPSMDRADLRRRQVAVGHTLEEVELILHPMVETAKEPTGSMGDDTPLAVLSSGYRGLHHFFRQQFSQVTNPPIDSLRERRVMSLKTRLGNLGNVLEVDSSQTKILQLDSPVLTYAEMERLRAHLGDQAVEIDCTFEVGKESLREAIDRIRVASEEAVRRGPVHLFLTDEKMSAQRAPVPMILAAGRVHTHLVEQGLRTFSSINVRSSECLDVHYFAVLVGVGATTINAWPKPRSAIAINVACLATWISRRAWSATKKASTPDC
jgi:glutamate synthase (NADPH/NADH) large chain